jgi:hypothetical protein
MGNRTKKSENLLRVIGMVIVSVGVNMGHALMQGKIYCIVRMVERLVRVSRVQIRGSGRGSSLQVALPSE